MALRTQRTPSYSIETFTAEEFISERFDYTAGQHVSFLAPTQAGKTTLAFRLLESIANPKLPAVALVMKPKDPTVQKWLDHLKQRGWKRVKVWPPVMGVRAPGYIFWPVHKFDPKKDNPELEAKFRKVLLWGYGKGNVIIFVDEVYGLTNELDLKDELNAIWSRGAGMGCGQWATSQRPYSVPQWMYSQPEHIFLAYTPDKRDRQRFSEIGGIEGKAVEEQVLRLPQYHWLYIRRTGPEWCIIGP